MRLPRRFEDRLSLGYHFVAAPRIRRELTHELGPVLDVLATLRHRRALSRHPVFLAHRAELQRVLTGFEWDLEQCATSYCGHPDHAVHEAHEAREGGSVRAVAWNVERGKRFEALEGVITAHPRLRSADLLLLTEVDIGMGRSGNRNIPQALAGRLGMSYVFANYHLVLAPGDQGERDVREPNTLSMHGAALLSRYPIRRFAAVGLPEYVDKFEVFEKRLGCKRALMCEVELPDGPLTVVVVHLDPFASPGHRAYQASLVLDALERFGGDRVLLGGDLNTNTYHLGSRIGLFTNVMHKLVRFGFHRTVEQYMTPERVFERKVFETFRRRGFVFDPFADPHRGSIHYDLTDPEIVDKSLGYLPGPVYRWLERRLEPWGGRVPLRLDWFAGRGITPIGATTVERPRYGGCHVSDHDPITVDVRLTNSISTPAPAPMPVLDEHP